MARVIIYATILILLAAIGIEYFQKQKQEAATQRVIEFGKQNELKISKEDFKRVEFKIEFDEAKWNDLIARLDNTRYFDRLKEVPEFSFGFNPEYSKELATYWRNSFDWRKQIQRLNKYTQYRATINNTIIHYIYHETNRELHKSKPSQPQINLLLIDGWPGCSFSFNKMIEKIESEYKDMSFRIFVPSIPGYGYSTPLNRVVDAVDTAILFDALMRYENAENYFVHGEDWGIFVATILGQLFSDRVRGLHLTSADSSEFSSLSNSISFLIGLYLPSTYYTEQEIKLDVPNKFSLSNRLWVFWSELGYFHFQATKPDTVAHGVTDSPVGLMAYVLEKYSSWSFNFEKEIVGKRDGGLSKFDKDELLSIITIYWMTNSISSSVRYYRANVESFFMGSEIRNEIFKAVMPAKVPIGFQLSINEIMVTPSRAAQIRFPNMIQFELVDNLGHFAAFHNPVITANNFIKFVLKSL